MNMKSTFLTLMMVWGCGDKSETGEPSDEPSSEPSEEINPLDVDDDNDGYTENEGDCDDSDRNTYPGATEYCNNNDDDCDNQVDENGVDGDTWYRDSDGDGYGSSSTVKSCDLPDGYTNNDDDCNDNDSSIHPGATEDLCNDIDENCSGDPDYTTDTSFHITILSASFPCAMDVPEVAASGWDSCDWDAWPDQQADGYVAISTPAETQWTNTVDGTANPVFNEMFTINLTSSQELGLFLYDQDAGDDEFGYGWYLPLSWVQSQADCGSDTLYDSGLDWGISYEITTF